jgi:hypothetical protein
MPRFTKKSNRKYKKVITTRKKNKFTRKYTGKRRGGAAAASVSAAKLPMIIDQNQVSYTCTPVPTS